MYVHLQPDEQPWTFQADLISIMKGTYMSCIKVFTARVTPQIANQNAK